MGKIKEHYQDQMQQEEEQELIEPTQQEHEREEPKEVEPSSTSKGAFTIKSTDLIYICGMRGQGKSYLMSGIVQQMPRYVIYDGATHQHSDKGTVVRTPQELDTTLTNAELKIVCQPLKDSPEIFDEFCKIIWKHGNLFFFVEEIGNYMNSHTCPPTADMLFRVGRNRGIGMGGLNQRPARIWNNFIALVDHWFVFRNTLPKDVDFLCEYLGEDKENEIKGLQEKYFFYMNSKNMKPIKCNPI